MVEGKRMMMAPNANPSTRSRSCAFGHRNPAVRGASIESSRARVDTGGTVTAHRAAVLDEYEASNPSSVLVQAQSLAPRADEPNLYNFPSTISPEYKSVPLPIKLVMGLLSIFTSTKLHRVANIIQTSGAKNPLNARHLKFILTAFASFFLSTMLIQDAFYAPNRLTTAALLQNKWLPSPLSKYSIVGATIPPQLHPNDHHLEINKMGVHFLEYENEESKSIGFSPNHKFDAIHFNHGFGASSLSWLPAIPSLVKKLGGRVGLAHDAPGFGFTDRPSATGRRGGLLPYSSAGSAALGNALLMDRLTNGGLNDVGVKKRVALFGHSMGCAPTLKMSLLLPPDVEKVIVLVSPALVGKFPKRSDLSAGETSDIQLDANVAMQNELDEGAKVKKSVAEIIRRQPVKIRNLVEFFIAVLRRAILDPVIIYLLRRLVG